MAKELAVLNLGLRSYLEVWELQKVLQAQLIDKKTSDHLLICEHPTCITYGRSANKENILEQNQVPLFEIERGGDVTLHSPGQLVFYPLLDLRNHKTDVGWYLRNLEEVVIKTASSLGLACQRIPGKTGVWTAGSDQVSSCEPYQRKIASIGVRISRWCTMHGVALNVNNDLRLFEKINPCGFNARVMSSLELELNRQITLKSVSTLIVQHFCEIFGFEAVRLHESKTTLDTTYKKDFAG